MNSTGLISKKCYTISGVIDIFLIIFIKIIFMDTIIEMALALVKALDGNPSL
ncbi:hypothetical protein [Ferruginibacter sp. SUN106]|uniref:hypothetical protein n=1 Tax=Ferruginibacter sp. SUN106 TaxID=2978348 RepID=UPI003D360ED2